MYIIHYVLGMGIARRTFRLRMREGCRRLRSLLRRLMLLLKRSGAVRERTNVCVCVCLRVFIRMHSYSHTLTTYGHFLFVRDGTPYV